MIIMPAKKTKKEIEVEPQNAKRDAEPKKVSPPQPQAPVVQSSEEKKGWFPKIDATLTKYSPFVKQNWKGLFTDGLKIAGMEWMVIIALIVIAIVILAAVGGGAMLGGTDSVSSITQMMASLGAAMILLIPLVIIALAISIAISFLRYPAVDERAKGGKIAIFQKLRELALPSIGYGLVITVITLVLFSPIILGIITQNLGAMCIFVILSILAVLVFVLVTQFSQWELTIEKAGVFESLGRSYGLVKGNIVEVIVFDIITIVFTILLYIPFWIASFVLNFIGMIGGIAGLGIILMGSLVITFVWSAVLLTVVVPLQYSFWKTLKEKT